MLTPDSQPTLLPVDVPLGVLVTLAILLLAAWVRSHAWCRGLQQRPRQLAWLGRATLGTLTLVAFAHLSRQVVTLATDWNLWILLAGGAAAIEAVLSFYRLERHAVPPRLGLTLAFLRVSLVLAVLAILCQPVLVFNFARTFQREVIILLDESDSMQVPDSNLTAGEKVRLATSLALPVPPRTHQLEQTAAALQRARDLVITQADWLHALDADDSARTGTQLFKNRHAMRESLRQVLTAASDATTALDATANLPYMAQDQAGKTQLTNLAAKLAAGVQIPLNHVLERIPAWRRASTNGIPERLDALTRLQTAATALAELGPPLRNAGERADSAFYHFCPDPDRATFDRVATMPRIEIARELLRGTPTADATNAPTADEPDSLLAHLQRHYGVRLFTVGAAPTEIAVRDVLTPSAARPPPSNDSAQRQRTDLTLALEKAAATLSPERTAGILLLSDGRHNAAASPEPIARSLGLEHVPIYPVVFGGNRTPPTDAAIVAVAAPDTVSTNDRVHFDIEIKADGCAGSNVTVRLFNGDQLVATNTLAPIGDTFRTRLTLSDQPRTNALHHYRIALDPLPTEVNSNNNVRAVPILVISDPIKVLLIDNVPRWEFRYIKNLFLDRNQNVQLQYLLFQPDEIEGETNRPFIAASVARPDGEVEASALPANESEWLKFDVILLGDVSPLDLGAEHQASLRRFVLNRGGSLVVMAGPRHMPHAYARTPLAELLPVSFPPSPQPILTAPEPAFRIALTAPGRDTVFMKLADEPEQNRAAWNAVPALSWRHGLLTAKPNATVLAYAAPTADTPPAAQTGLVPDADELLAEQQRERNRALIVTHQAGFGNVLLLATDQMWRLRYREGDTRHHKFWGQILRWATADRLAGGSATLRLGTDRPRYASDSPVRVRARVTATDFTPVVDATLHVRVWSGTRLVLRRKLAYVADSPGVYSADIGTLPEGNYRVELDPKEARRLPEPLTEPVSTEFAVSDAIATESVELTADRALLARIATLSNGAMISPLDLPRIADRLGPPTVRKEERRQLDLWNSWPWLIAILTLFTAEWVLRRKVRLP